MFSNKHRVAIPAAIALILASGTVHGGLPNCYIPPPAGEPSGWADDCGDPALFVWDGYPITQNGQATCDEVVFTHLGGSVYDVLITTGDHAVATIPITIEARKPGVSIRHITIAQGGLMGSGDSVALTIDWPFNPERGEGNPTIYPIVNIGKVIKGSGMDYLELYMQISGDFGVATESSMPGVDRVLGNASYPTMIGGALVGNLLVIENVSVLAIGEDVLGSINAGGTIGRLEVGGNLADDVTADAINILQVGGDVTGDIHCRTGVSGPHFGVNDAQVNEILVFGDLLGDVVAASGPIELIDVSFGAIGSPSIPVDIEAKGWINTIEAGEVNAHISAGERVARRHEGLPSSPSR